MDKEKESLVTRLCYLVFIAHTLCLIELIDVLLFKKLFITSFLLILGILSYLNLKIYRTYFNK